MKRIVFVISLAIIASSVYSQKVNLSGTWKLNESKSELGDQFSLAPNTIVLKHEKKSLEVEKQGSMQGTEYTSNDILTLDGEECENPGFMDSVKKSTAVWDKKTKVLKIISKIPMEDGTDVDITEEMTMDGENLILESTASSSYGDLVERFVFDKQ